MEAAASPRGEQVALARLCQGLDAAASCSLTCRSSAPSVALPHSDCNFNSCRGAGGRKRDPKTFQGMFGCCVPGSTIPRHSKSNKQVVGDLKQISSRLMHEDLLLCVLG
ncbi:unnamed protein product [Urochloa humidicola]